MLNSLFRHAAPWACAWMLWTPAALAADTSPSDPVAVIPFNQYQNWRDEPLQDWRAVNERVGEVGGWRTYLREAQGDMNDMGNAHHGHHGHHGQ